jgi:hypothetical protein
MDGRRNSQIDRQVNKQTDRCRERKMDGQRGIQTHELMMKQSYRQTGK